MLNKFKRKVLEIKVLLRSVPSPIITMFAVSVIMMNLLANKSISLPMNWLALDCGIIVSWISFLSMDIITKHFGPKAATQVSIVAVLVNLVCCGFFFLCAIIPGVWGVSFEYGVAWMINEALDSTFMGTWYVLFGSTVAFIVSAIVNNSINYGVGKLLRLKDDGFGAYALRTYISTAIGQFCDNLVFALIVSHFFFGWTLLQCITCSLTGMVVELILESIFSPIGFRICRKWKNEGVGKEFFELKGELK